MKYYLSERHFDLHYVLSESKSYIELIKDLVITDYMKYNQKCAIMKRHVCDFNYRFGYEYFKEYNAKYSIRRWYTEKEFEKKKRLRDNFAYGLCVHELAKDREVFEYEKASIIICDFCAKENNEKDCIRFVKALIKYLRTQNESVVYIIQNNKETLNTIKTAFIKLYN